MSDWRAVVQNFDENALRTLMSFGGEMSDFNMVSLGTMGYECVLFVVSNIGWEDLVPFFRRKGIYNDEPEQRHVPEQWNMLEQWPPYLEYLGHKDAADAINDAMQIDEYTSIYSLISSRNERALRALIVNRVCYWELSPDRKELWDALMCYEDIEWLYSTFSCEDITSACTAAEAMYPAWWKCFINVDANPCDSE